jgi:hypothetical protein
MFLVLDVDNTLLHTLTLANTSRERRVEIITRLNTLYPGTQYLKDLDAAVIPRPGLREFQAYLAEHQGQIKFGIYSSAKLEYFERALSKVAPWLIRHATFIWDVNYCIDESRFKSLAKVAEAYRLPLENIFAIDDLPCIGSKENRIPIKPFEVQSLQVAHQDFELARVLGLIERTQKTL